MSSTSIASMSRHTLRQLKFILPGGLVTLWLDSHHKFWRIYNGEAGTGSFAWTVSLLALVSGVLTIGLFMYVLMFPLIRGEQPDYKHWRQSGFLSTVIPVMTASILTGWSLLTYTLARWSNLGYIEGVIGASGLYALAFGLLGLIPAPRVKRA
ncbi:hypothetical protein BXZ70DRAFT_936190 [Cristinia sonorae]|uniref:Transmembrane protein n=1 Tax=Cristinia sonorae TaxID=1940300 RepID=A0A8K0UNV5_9AGAR|nr:hypothetical protein BXZ70DRAFT_936190 [Cristinia sonorae]